MFAISDIDTHSLTTFMNQIQVPNLLSYQTQIWKNKSWFRNPVILFSKLFWPTVRKKCYKVIKSVICCSSFFDCPEDHAQHCFKNEWIQAVYSNQKQIGINFQFISYSKCFDCCQTFNVYLLFAISMGQIQSKLIYISVTYWLANS